MIRRFGHEYHGYVVSLHIEPACTRCGHRFTSPPCHGNWARSLSRDTQPPAGVFTEAEEAILARYDYLYDFSVNDPVLEGTEFDMPTPMHGSQTPSLTVGDFNASSGEGSSVRPAGYGPVPAATSSFTPINDNDTSHPSKPRGYTLVSESSSHPNPAPQKTHPRKKPRHHTMVSGSSNPTTTANTNSSIAITDSNFTPVCGITTPLKEIPFKKMKKQSHPYHCPRCDSEFSRRYTVKQHFPRCVKKYGNPDGLTWMSHVSCQTGNPYVSRVENSWNRKREEYEEDATGEDGGNGEEEDE